MMMVDSRLILSAYPFIVEVRNPLSAALSACNFVSSEIEAPEPLTTTESIESVKEDLNIVHTSLQFINDLLR